MMDMMLLASREGLQDFPPGEHLTPTEMLSASSLLQAASFDQADPIENKDIRANLPYGELTFGDIAVDTGIQHNAIDNLDREDNPAIDLVILRFCLSDLSSNRRWTGALVPYEISSEFESKHRQVIANAIKGSSSINRLFNQNIVRTCNIFGDAVSLQLQNLMIN